MCKVRMAGVVLSNGRTGLARFWLHGNQHTGHGVKKIPLLSAGLDLSVQALGSCRSGRPYYSVVYT
jgi:hypothetical protein